MNGYEDYMKLPPELQQAIDIPISFDRVNHRHKIRICPQSTGDLIMLSADSFLTDTELDNVITVLAYYKQCKQDAGTWTGGE